MRTLASAFVLLCPLVASAHPGHGTLPSDSVFHWIAEPLHAGVIATGLTLALLSLPWLAHTVRLRKR
jgi:hypothetical protein